MWRKSAQAIMDDIRRSHARKVQEVAEARAREEGEAKEALDALRAEVEAARARKVAKKSA